MSYVEDLRSIVEEHMTPEAPLAQALTKVADALDQEWRGQEALAEQLEDLQERVGNLEAHNTTAVEPEVP